MFVYLIPNPQNTLRIDAEALAETRRLAARAWDLKYHMIKQGMHQRMLRAELDNLEILEKGHSAALTTNLSLLANTLLDLPATPESPRGKEKGLPPPSRVEPRTEGVYTVTVYPGDPAFEIQDSLPQKIWPMLYLHQQRWLPSYGPWHIRFTSSAMQLRNFPRNLRGQANFQNSMSLKLITSLTDVISRISLDFYSDLRHLSDTMSALCLMTAYYSEKTQTPLPTNLQELLGNITAKVTLLVRDLKRAAANKGFNFNKNHSSLLPPQGGVYSNDFFQEHALYALFRTAGMLASSSSSEYPKADSVLAITAAVFGDNIPPFAAYQWNLRSGLQALESFILLFLLLDVNVPPASNKRLHLETLLGESYSKGSRPPTHRPGPLDSGGSVFNFLIESFLVPTLLHRPTTNMSALFPGLYLVQLEFSAGASTPHAIHLADVKFREIFNILIQSNVFQDSQELIRAKQALRIRCEAGSGNLLESLSPGTTMRDIIRKEFMAQDVYDFVYFCVLGALPVTVAVV
uniref:DNA packaging tegument protein UL25 n=1 Tax=Wood mouse herpesvirus TaxID=432370 RepID=D0PPA8_9GAMA|nr:DNA packaging tegument protein UL25 [Wood mouse herpesvirus]